MALRVPTSIGAILRWRRWSGFNLGSQNGKGKKEPAALCGRLNRTGAQAHRIVRTRWRLCVQVQRLRDETGSAMVADRRRAVRDRCAEKPDRGAPLRNYAD